MSAPPRSASDPSGGGLAAPPPASTPAPLIERVLGPFQQFARTGASGGILLLICTAVALAWANSPWGAVYEHLWETPVTVGIPGFGISDTLHHLINDGLMVVFFFLVGLEIKREVLAGELASVQRAAFPIAAAVGGMVAPALLYAALNAGGEGAAGWGVPMATDIAFALGVLALLGPRIPLALKVFLAALAIVDDIGAVLVIAFFYTAEVDTGALAAAAGCLVLLVALNRAGARHPLTYTVVGVALWAAFLASGVHATVAGVLLALTIPVRTRIDTIEFRERAQRALRRFEDAGEASDDVLTNAERQEAIHNLERACEQAQAPLQRMEHSLHGVVAFFIMPLFALANAGVRLEGDVLAMATHPVSLGIILGLVVGKPLGITLFAWAAVRARWAARPHVVGWKAIHGVSWLGGIGFTMSLFIATLAFEGTTLLPIAKLGILVASLVAGLVGWLILRRAREEAAGE